MASEIDYREEAAQTFLDQLLEMRDVMNRLGEQARKNFPIGFIPEDQDWIFKRVVELLVDGGVPQEMALDLLEKMRSFTKDLETE